MDDVMHWDDLHTWYQVEGSGDRTPVIVLHGGPGATHDEVSGIAALVGDERQIALYDQVGNGRSTLRPDAPAEFWSVDLFKDELSRLITRLGWEEGYHLVGHSWGGMLALEHAFDRPSGLRSLVLSDTHSSLKLFDEAAVGLFAALPEPTPEAFAAAHVCRVSPMPVEVARTAELRALHPEVFAAMNGPNPFDVTGNLRGWDVTTRLPEVTVPVLVVSGRHDVVTPEVTRVLVDGLPDARWELFPDSSHMPFVEEPDRFRREATAFLDNVDQR